MVQTLQSVASPGVLEAGTVHLWHIDPLLHEDMLQRASEAAYALLQPQEMERVRRMRAGLARAEMALSRACARVLLGAALACRPQDVCIESGADGKPHCVGHRAGDLHFNLTHSHGRILVALCRRARVGVDLERVDDNVDVFEVAQANFAAGELRAIRTAASFEQATRTFYRIWTGKEALLKAHGSGLMTPLDGFDLGSMNARDEQCHVVGGEGSRSLYFLRGIPVSPASADGSSFVAALALSEPHFEISSHHIQGAQVLQLLANAA